MGIMSKINLDLLYICRLLQEVHRACYVKFSGATVMSQLIKVSQLVSL